MTGQLFFEVWQKKPEICRVTFRLLHFWQRTFFAPSSLIGIVTVNFFPQLLHL